jgi:endonuclease/exonuclease/phosphatase family metal-dependent hydrolase
LIACITEGWQVKARIKKWLIAFAIIMIVFVGWLRFGNPRIKREPPDVRQDLTLPLQVVSLNAHLLPGAARWLVSHRSNADYRTREIVRRFKQYDLIGLCEVFDESQAAALIDGFNSNQEFEFIRSPPPPRLLHFTSGGLLLLSKHAMTEQANLTFTEGSRFFTSGFRSADGLAAKGALFAKLKTTSPDCPEIDCYLTHLESDSAEIRTSQLIELAGFIQATRDPATPFVLMGDLNISGPKSPSDNSSTEVTHLEYNQMLKQLSFANTRLIDTGLPNSLETSGTSNPISESGGQRIDYVFLGIPEQDSSTLAPRIQATTQVLRLKDEHVPEGSLSDHAALLTTLATQPNTQSP